jgi:tetratricopeptide (TPR) repeat protein
VSRLAAALALAAGLALAAPPDTHFERAGQAWQEGDRDRALKEYDAALSTGGESAVVRHNRALVLLEMKDAAGAREDAARAVALAPKEGRYRVTLAAAWMAGEKPENKKARGILKAAVRLLGAARDHVGLGRAYYNLGLVARRLGDMTGAKRDFRRSLDEDPAGEAARTALESLESAPAAR